MSSPLVKFNGYYLAARIRVSSIPSLEMFSSAVSADVLAGFSDLEKRAEEVPDAEYKRLISSYSWDDSTSEEELWEIAREKGLSFFLMMSDFRQATVNLLVVGLFHLFEQQLHHIATDGLFSGLPRLEDTMLSKTEDWYRKHLEIDFQSYPGWDVIANELRLLANAIKHGEGNSAAKLRDLKPDLFRSPYASDDGILRMAKNFVPMKIGMPLNGENIYVPHELLRRYGESVLDFLEAWAADLDRCAAKA
jgi:hypothetical protein